MRRNYARPEELGGGAPAEAAASSPARGAAARPATGADRSRGSGVMPAAVPAGPPPTPERIAVLGPGGAPGRWGGLVGGSDRRTGVYQVQ